MQHEIQDHYIYVMIGAAYHPYPCEPESSEKVYQKLVGDVIQLVTDGGVFIHTTPDYVTSVIKIVPGTVMQVVPGKVLRRAQNEARQMQAMAASRIVRQ